MLSEFAHTDSLFLWADAAGIHHFERCLHKGYSSLEFRYMKNASKKISKNENGKSTVRSTANRIFTRYQKTFEDLAKYDKGEKIKAR